MALETGDQGYGAVIVRRGRIVGQAPSRVVVNRDPCPSYLSHPGHQRILRRRWRRAFQHQGGKVFSENGVWICLPAVGKVFGAAGGAAGPWRSQWRLHCHTRTLKQNPAVSGRAPLVPMMEPADLWKRHALSDAVGLDRSSLGGVLAQRKMGSGSVVIIGGTKQGSVSDAVRSRRSRGPGIRASRCQSGVPHTDSATGFVAP